MLALATFAVRRAGPDAPERPPYVWVFAAIAVILGALQGAASLADRGHPIVAGVIVGAACAALGFVAVRDLLIAHPAAPRRRDRRHAARSTPRRAALAAAGLSVLFPPLAILVIAGLVALLVGGRRRSGEKYAGLRILR